METKHIIALIIFMAIGSTGLLLTLLSQKLRDAALFFIVLGAVVMGRMDVNFLGEGWYRGTSRGIELTLVDVAAWCLLIATALMPRYRAQGRWYVPAGLGLMTLYFGYCCFSVATSEPQLFGLWELSKVLRGLIVFLAAAVFIRTPRELLVMVLGLACAVGVETIYGLEQRVWKGLHRVPGTLFHENSLSMYLCMVAPVLLAATLSDWPRWVRWVCGVACACATLLVVMTLSRAGIPTYGMVMFGTALFCTTWRITKRKIMIAATTVAAVSLLLISSWDALVMRFGQASLHDEFLKEDAVETRGVYWRIVFAIAEEEPYGVGLNNWSYAVSKYYGPQLGYRYDDYDLVSWEKQDSELTYDLNHAPPAHSLAVITWGELGFPGLCIFGLLWLRWFQVGATFLRGRLNPDPMHRLGIGFLFGALGLFTQGITEWTYRQTSIMFTFHVMMGALASIYYARRFRAEPKQAEEELEEADEFEVEATPVAVSAVRAQR
jgi:hypothetical protein